MDHNKHIKLQEIGYTIKQACDICVHSAFNGTSSFGECRLHRYEHEKHTDADRRLSIFKNGHCGDYNRGSTSLGPWEEFVEHVY
jgi:hypothetical protein